MHDYSGISMGNLPPHWGQFGHNEWKDEIDRNLVKLVFANAAEFQTFKNTVELKYHVRKPFAGRLVQHPYPQYGILYFLKRARPTPWYDKGSFKLACHAHVF
jgi:hypothetical protein